MTGMAVLLLVRPIVRHRDRFAQSDERGEGWNADGEHLDRAREHRGLNAGFPLPIALAGAARDSQPALSRQLYQARIESRGSRCVMPQQRHLATERWLRLGRSARWIARRLGRETCR